MWAIASLALTFPGLNNGLNLPFLSSYACSQKPLSLCRISMKKTTRLRRIRPSLFQTRGRQPHKKAAIVDSADVSAGKFGSWREEMEIDSRTGRKRCQTERKTPASEEEDDRGGSCEKGKEEKQNNEKEEVEVGRRIEALQRIVPGGDSVGVDKLFEKTAGYILCLQRQVKALRTLSIILERLDKEKTKCGC